jgi:AraC-like DNA-binding protein
MLLSSYLSLHVARLAPSEKWACDGEELFLVFPKEGIWQLSTSTSTTRVVAGDAIIMSGRSGAKLCSVGKTDLEFAWFAVSLDHLFPLFATGEICLIQNVPTGLRIPKVYSAADPIAVQCHRLLAEISPKCDINHRSQLLRAAALLISAEIKSKQRQQFASESAEDHMMRVFEQLPSHQLLNLSVDELSQKFGCSRRHLNRLFHQRFGFSVASLRMEMRLLKASFLLRDPDVKVINVAEQCSFNHLGLFNTCFKRRFGVTPGAWRSLQTAKDTAGKPNPAGDTCPLRLNGLCPWNGNPGECAPKAPLPAQNQKPGPSRALITNLEDRRSGTIVPSPAKAKAGLPDSLPLLETSPTPLVPTH